MTRMFIALEPSDKEALGALLPRRFDGRPAPVKQLHLTLAFFGSASPEEVKALRKIVNGLSSEALRLVPRELLLKRDGLLCLTFEEDPALEQLYQALCQELSACGLPHRDKLWPHVTLARKARECPEVLLPPEVLFTRLVLFESQLSSQGALHIPRVARPLV